MDSDICVIVPTIREYECVRAYAENARAHDFDTDRLHVVLVTEDFCETDAMERMLDEEGLSGEVFDGSRREAWYDEQDITEFAHLVPAASHAETSFGLLYMWNNRKFERGVFIDDDTLPHEETDFFGEHMATLDGNPGGAGAGEGSANEDGTTEDGASESDVSANAASEDKEIEHVASDEGWVNVLYQNADEHGLYPRGYPYAAMDETVETRMGPIGDVVASQGLWTNVPDLDAVRILMDGDLEGQAQTRTTAADYDGDFVAARGQYLTVCSMNLAFEREVIPAFYQLPMDDNPWEVGRFDDIWSGVFLKRAADVLGKQVVTGSPLCVHNKAARSTFGDLTNEVPALECNEHVWEIVDAVGEDADSYAAVFGAMASALAEGDFSGYENGAFLNFVGEYMHDWLACLDALDPGTIATETDHARANPTVE